MLNTTLLNSRLIREKDALLQFEVMAWLIRRYGAPSRPNVPSPLHRTQNFEDLYWDENDARSVFDWANDCFGMIKADSQMDDWSVTVIPTGDSVDPTSVMPTRQLPADPGQPPYIVDLHGRPVFFYDPRDCLEPGYFTTRTILRLAELRLTGFEPESPLSSIEAKIACLTTACYARQGLVLANLPFDVGNCLRHADERRTLHHRIIINTLCFSTCLALRVKQQSEEMILATYGQRMSKAFRRKVRQACRQIDAYAQELKLLQVMSEPASHFAANPARFAAQAQFA